MKTREEHPQINNQKAIIKATIFVAFIVSAIIVIRYTPIKTSLTAEDLISPKAFYSLGLFVFSLFIPKIIKKIKGEEN